MDRQMHAAIPHLLEALRAIPQHEKLEYLQVLRVAPELVEKESDPLAFLRYCNWNPEAAARRLTVYWRKRKEAFGEARAFLPLDDFSGNGALGSDEIELLRLGGFSLMPRDTHGRDVVFFDRQLFPPALCERADVRLRAFFWVLVQVSRNALSQTTGCVAIGLPHVTQGATQGDRDSQYAAIELLREAAPVRVHSIHVVFVQERMSLLQSAGVFILQNWWGFFCRVVVHCCQNEEQPVPKLARHGIAILGRNSTGSGL